MVPSALLLLVAVGYLIVALVTPHLHRRSTARRPSGRDAAVVGADQIASLAD